jgi:hypothetical protein
VIALRLIALKFLLNIFVQVMTQVTVRGGYPDSLPFSNPFHTAYVLVMVGSITGGFMLWALALPIAQHVTRGLPQELSFGAVSRVDCYSVGFIGVGLWLGAVYFAEVLNWAHYLLWLGASGDAATEELVTEVDKYSISASIIPFILGIVLLFNGRKWARCLAQRDERNERIEAAKAQDQDVDA